MNVKETLTKILIDIIIRTTEVFFIFYSPTPLLEDEFENLIFTIRSPKRRYLQKV